METKDLKNKIINKTLDDSPLILKYQDNEFLCNQYVEEICKARNLQKLDINNLTEMSSENNFFDGDEANYLYVLNVGKLEEEIRSENKNLVVICKEVPDNLTVDFINMTKVLPWQIEDYVKYRLPGLDESQVKWLCEITKYNIYRLDEECKKIEIFPKPNQSIIFDEMNNDDAYCDLNSLTIFNFITSVVNKDHEGIANILKYIEYIDIEPAGVVTLLLKQYKTLIDASFYQNWNSSLSCSEKQFKYVKYALCKKYTCTELIKIYGFLTELDYKLKTGLIDYDNMISYILTNILDV